MGQLVMRLGPSLSLGKTVNRSKNVSQYSAIVTRVADTKIRFIHVAISIPNEDYVANSIRAIRATALTKTAERPRGET